MRRIALPTRFDLSIAAALVVVAVIEVTLNSALVPKPAGGVIEIAMAVSTAWRRSAPLVAAVVVAAGGALEAAVGVPPNEPMIPTLTAVIIVYALVSYSRWRIALGGTVIVAGGVGLQVLVAHQDLGNLAFAYTFIGLFLAIGRVVRIRTSQAVRAQLRVEQMQREQADREREIAAEERNRIAHEMHDVIAHSVSVMVVQAGGVQQVLTTDPEAAGQALERIQMVGRQAIAELGRLLGVLREDTAEMGLAPQPKLSDLPRLIADAEAAGLPVRWEATGAPRPLPAGVELAVYRVVQEALTNARKHAGTGATASVVLDYGADGIDVEVADDGTRPSAGPGTGHGLVGMRERVSTYGGTLSAGPDGSGFRVRARIPLGAE